MSGGKIMKHIETLKSGLALAGLYILIAGAEGWADILLGLMGV